MLDFLYFLPWDGTAHQYNRARFFEFFLTGRDGRTEQATKLDFLNNMITLVLLCQVAVLSHERKCENSCAIVPSGCPVPWKKIWKLLCYCAINNSCAIVPTSCPVPREKIWNFLCYCARWSSCHNRENNVLLCQVAKLPSVRKYKKALLILIAQTI